MDDKGILYYPDGDYYIGDFKKDKKEGFGMYYQNETKNYIIGQFSNNKRISHLPFCRRRQFI